MQKTKILKNKKILIGITSGAAIYKICTLVRLLRRYDAQIRVVMTEGATKLISPLLFQSLSGNPVSISVFSVQDNGQVDHIALAQWADLFIVAPATANTIGKMANGIADNLLTTIFLAFPEEKEIIIAPAMETNMWENVFVKENIQRLKKRKNLQILEPKEGLLVSQKIGKGRMVEPEEILASIQKVFKK